MEVLAIVLGVALGFLVSEWRQDRADRATGDAALRAIATEMSHNCANLRTVQPYYLRMAQTLDSLRQVGRSPRTPREIPGFQGINPPLLRTGAYDVAVATGALSLMPFETASAAGMAYATQAITQRTVDEVVRATMVDGLSNLEGMARMMIFLGEASQASLYVYDRAAGPAFVEHGFSCPLP